MRPQKFWPALLYSICANHQNICQSMVIRMSTNKSTSLQPIDCSFPAAVETKTIETLTFSMLDTSCLIVVRKKAPSGRLIDDEYDELIDDRITIVKLNSASFEIVGNGGEPGNLTSIADKSKFHKPTRPAS